MWAGYRQRGQQEGELQFSEAQMNALKYLQMDNIREKNVQEKILTAAVK